MKIIYIMILSLSLFGCSIFNKKIKNGNVLVGRNFDWSGSDGKVALYPATKKTHGMILISQDNPNRPYEGMNDKGLFMAITAVPYSPTFYNILKPARVSLSMIKEILSTSSTIDEAIKQFDKYAVNFGQFLGNPIVHFKLVQNDGSTAIIEFVNNEMRVLRDKKISTIMTNHYNSQDDIKTNSKTSHARYKIIQNSIDGVNDVSEVFMVLKDVEQKDTLWSNVYNLTKQIVYLKLKDKDIFIINLKDELYAKQKPYFYSFSKLHNNSNTTEIKRKNLLFLRPQFGLGSRYLIHNGIRVLLAVNSIQKYGLEVTNFQNKNENFTAIGIMLEQRLYSWFNMSMGTIGYIGYNKENTFGFSSNLGWEPDNNIPFLPFVTFRNDVIFATNKIDSLYFISIGFGF